MSREMTPRVASKLAGLGWNPLLILAATLLVALNLEGQGKPPGESSGDEAARQGASTTEAAKRSHMLGGRAKQGWVRCYICVPHLFEDDCLWVMMPLACPPPEAEVKGWVHGEKRQWAERVSIKAPQSPPPAKRHGVGRAFWLMALLHGAAAGADIGTTANRCAHCVEANPLLGRHPSTGKLVGISLPLFFLSTWADYRVKKNAKSGWWLLIPVVGIAGHSAAAIHNALLR